MKFNYVPAYGFGKAKKCELNKNDQLITPGPARYKPIKLLKHEPEWKIGTSPRLKDENKENPGPGSYNLSSSKGTNGPSYSIATKPIKIMKDMVTPGPATYNPLNLDKKSSYTFGHKYKDKARDISPGPGNYNIRTEKDLIVPSTIFGHEKKKDFGDASKSPGPGNYNNDINSTNIQHPKYSFGREKRMSDNNNGNPGPGSYKHKEYIGRDGNKISMGLKGKSKSMECIPGPGQYQTSNYDNILRKLPNIKIGKQKRFYDSYFLTDNPGPGQYNDAEKIKNVKLNKPSWKIGTSLRKPLIDIIDSPGPGNYNLSKNIGEGAPKYTMRIRDKSSGERFNTPGPGNYDSGKLNLFKKNPSWKIGTSKRESLKLKIEDGFPGPGTYKYSDKHLLTAPKYQFGTEKKYRNKYNDSPGPGTYHIPCSIVEINNYTREQGVFDNNFKFI